MALLHASELEKAFGDRVVLRGCGLTVEQGDRVGLVGANGCGKSTLLKLLAGEDEADSGRIHRGAKNRVFKSRAKASGSDCRGCGGGCLGVACRLVDCV